MNKKLLFGIMSLAALAACTNDDFEGKNGAQLSEQVSPIQFEVINGNEAMRASMPGNKVVWSAEDGDLFTLYHGATLGAITGFENATYKAVNTDGVAKLTTPSMIKTGGAVMVWPVDSTFRIKPANDLAITIDADQAADIENHIPYMSDLINIGAYNAAAPYNTEGYNRTYPVYMRPMASQLILKADYAGTDAALKAMEAGADGIAPIQLTSVEIRTKAGGNTPFNKSVKVAFTAPAGTSKWATVSNHAWNKVTDYEDLTVGANLVTTDYLSTKCINGTESAKFLVLPQNVNATGFSTVGIDDGAVVVNTTYGKVYICATAAYPAGYPVSYQYNATELGDAWYRYQAAGTTAVFSETATSIAGTGTDANKVRFTNNIALGLAQVINAFSTNTMKNTSDPVFGEHTGAAGTRYVKVLLTKLNMNGLHVKTDKQLYDAVRVWKEIGAAGTNVTVNLDGDAKTGEFEISQKTIAKINEINAATGAEDTPRKFTVTACSGIVGEACNTIVVTGGGEIQDLSFIVNTTAPADVALKAGETWKWSASTVASKKAVIVDATANGVKSIINKGKFESKADATLAVYNNATTPGQVTTIKFVNDGEWEVDGAKINVQFSVTNNGKLKIDEDAQYRMDGAGNIFTNEATTLPERFVLNDPSIAQAVKDAFVEQIGEVENKGVFASVNSGAINNYGLIEHKTAAAKTYVTDNQQGTGVSFATPFSATVGSEKKMGRINLPYSIRSSADNVSISNALNKGFVSLTVDGDAATLNASEVGPKVNYIIVKSGVTKLEGLKAGSYLEVNQPGTELAWATKADGTAVTYSLQGLIVLSDINIKQNVTVTVTDATYLAADMFVGGLFTNGTAAYNGYYGNTTLNAATKYITY